MKTPILSLIVMVTLASLCQAQPVTSGLIPKTPTFYVNTNYFNNGSVESPGVAIAANGNVLFGWEDDGPELYDFMGVWTLYDGNGNLLTPLTVQTNRSDFWTPIGSSVANTYLSYFRSDGTPTPAYTASMPKVKANLFGNGLGMAGTVEMWLGLEVAELYDINLDQSAEGNGFFAAVQMLNNNGSPVNILTGGTDANYEPDGKVRIADWEFLSNGNIVIANESRQVDDQALTGQLSGNVPTYRIVTPAGVEVKAWSAASSEAVGAEMWHGVGVTANGFALRFSGGGVKVRLFDNAGNPTTTNIDLTALTGQNQGGNRGDAAGFHGNGRDAYVNINTVNPGTGNTPWVTVLNADGTLRWSRKVGDTGDDPVSDRVDAAIAADGRVIAVWDSALANAAISDPYTTPPTPVTNRVIQARLFSASGQPLGGRFVVSEWENPANPATINTSEIPRVAWRGDTIAIAWLSRNAPTVLADPNAPPFGEVVAARLFSTALVPKGDTFYVNTNYLFNGKGESDGVAIANNGNVLIGWEDDMYDGSPWPGITDFEAVWTLFDGQGNRLTPETVITNYDGTESITNTYLSYFRPDGTPTPGIYSWGPKIKANLFGDGLGMGAVAYDPIGSEIPYLEDINADDGGYADFPAVQLLNNNGTPAGSVLTGASDAEAQPVGAIRIADWDYLATGNIVIVGESRQADDYVLTGQTGGKVPVYRIVTPAGVEVKTYSAVSSEPVGSDMWHGVGVTANGFAVRFNPSGAAVRLFDNAGNPISTNLNLATVAGHPEAGGGGRGDGIGFHGNGKDAYVYVCGSGNGPWVTVLNADGTLRWSRGVADAGETIGAGSGDADGAIAPDGRVIVVWDSPLPNAAVGDPSTDPPTYVTNRLVQARLFSADGQPFGGRFVVSEWENPANPATTKNETQTSRVAWRGDTVAITWLSQNAPILLPPNPEPTGDGLVVGARLFNVISLPEVRISKSSGGVTIGWTGGGTLQSADEVKGGWTDIGDVNPLTVSATDARKFYRVRAW